MSNGGTALSFKIVEGRTYVYNDPLLLWLWERYAEHDDLGREDEKSEVRDIIAAIMEAKP